MNHKTFTIIPIALLLLLLLGCPNPVLSPDAANDPGEARRITLSETNPVTGVKHEKGVLGPGALYEIWVPPASAAPPLRAWNRSLVIYAHGYANPSQPVALTRDVEGMLSILLGNGFAVAHTSYSENGWAVKDGAIRVRQLREYFAGSYGAPAKVYLVGASEGALISIMLAEKNPELFSGALCIGGPLGGADMEVKYIYNIRILFDYFFGNELAVIAGLAGVPPALVPDPLKPLLPWAPLAKALQEALGKGALDAKAGGSPLLDPDGMGFAEDVVPLLLVIFQMSSAVAPEALWMATTMVDGVALFNWSPVMLSTGAFLPELAATIAGGLWYNIFGTEDILSRTHGHVPVDNTASVYAYPETLTILRTFDVERLASRPDARKYLEHWYQATGKLRIPVVILHTERDPIVPVTHALKYQEFAAASGSSAFLQVDVIPYFGHCQILVPPAYQPDAATFGARVLLDFNMLLQLTGTPPLVMSP